MEILKPNDIFVASLNNPKSTTYDFMSAQLNPNNTSLFSKDQYKESKFVQDTFKDDKGQFDEIAFNNAYDIAASHYKEMSDETYLSELTEAVYSPFDISRPIGSKTFDTSVEYTKDFNPFKQLYSRTGVNSVDDNGLSLRELAQQNKIFDTKTGQWSELSANDKNIFDKFFGETLVYAQWDEDGTHLDPESGRTVNHKKGDWKTDDDGNLYLETLGNRELYGKQVVNPMDMLTTDGSFANKFDVFDSDSREKSMLKTTAKLAIEIAPFFIPGVNTVYGGLKAALGLSSILPTFYKAFEGILAGDKKTSLSDVATSAENYMAKFNQISVSDKAQESFFNYEQIAQMTGDIFSQIYEQRAAATLSHLIMKPSLNKISGKNAELLKKVDMELAQSAMAGKIDIKDFEKLRNLAIKKIPELDSVIKTQSKLAKSLSLGYMALTQSADIYGQAIQGGYNRRTAGFAALGAAAGQYGIMMNNRMGDWFLDKTTGYSLETNKALMRKSILPLLDEVEEGFTIVGKDVVSGKAKLSQVFSKMKGSIENTFLTPSVIGEAMWKNALVEGVEEVTEQVVLDATKGIIDTMSYLGLTDKKGSFGGWGNVFSEQGLENYLANFVGGLLGGAMFEFQRSKLDNIIERRDIINNDTKEDLYHFIANGQKDEIINIIASQKSKWGNSYIGPIKDDGTYDVADGKTVLSQADIIAGRAIDIVNTIDGIINSQGLAHTDEEIVSKAIRDYMIIKDLNAFKGDSRVGIEGMVLKDYKDNVAKIVDLTAKINSLSEKSDENKEIIKELSDERKIYKDNVNALLSGEKAEEYFKKSVFYLSKVVSEPWVAIDKETFTRVKYNKSFNDLRDSGIGTTKESVDKEFKDYLDSKDMNKYLDVAYRAFEDLLLKAAPVASQYISSGYANERMKTFKNVLNLMLSEHLFDTSDNAAIKIQSFLAKAKLIEEKTGQRVLPWDAVFSDAAKTYANSTGFKVEKQNEVMEIGEQKLTKKEIAENILANTIAELPPDKLNYEVLSMLYDQRVAEFNKSVIDSKKEQLDPLIQEMNQLKNTLDPENQAQIDRINEITEEIDSHLLNAKLIKFNETEQFKENLYNVSLELQASNPKYTSAIIERFKSLPKVVTQSQIPEDLPLRDLVNLMNKLNYVLGLNLDIASIFEKLEAELEKRNLEPEEIQTILNGGKYKGTKRSVKNAIAEFNNAINNAKVVINNEVLRYNDEARIYNEFKAELNEVETNLLANSPSIFGTLDSVLPVIIKEIKDNKNLDGELLNTAKEIINKYLAPIVASSKTLSFNNQDIINLVSLSDSELNQLVKTLRTTLSKNSGDGNIDEVLDNYSEGISKLPKEYTEVFTRILDQIINADEQVQDKMINSLSEIITLVEKVLRNKNSLTPIKDLVETIEDGKNYKENTIYNLLRKFDVFLSQGSTIQVEKLWNILESEQTKLLNGSSVDAYFASGVKIEELNAALDRLKLLESVFGALSTTTLSYGDPYGLIASIQGFAKRNKIDSEISKVETVSSDMVQLMLQDIARLKNKLGFFKDLSKYNSGILSKEQALIKTKFNKLLLKNWQELATKNIIAAGSPVIPELDDILKSNKSDEHKLLLIEEALYNNTKDLRYEDKLALGKQFANVFQYDNVLDTIYSKDGSDEITKDIQSISNNDMLLYLLSAMSVNARDFNIKLLNALRTNFDKAPFFTQELGIKIMYASLVNKDLFTDVLRDISPIFKGDNENETLTHDASLITFIIGNAGTGKTTVMYKLLLSILQQSNQHMDLWFSGPESEQANKLKSDVLGGFDESRFGSKTFSKNKLFEELGIKEIVQSVNNDTDPKFGLSSSKEGSVLKIANEDLSTLIWKTPLFELPITIPTNLPDIIFIDETSHYTALELELINEVVRRAGADGKIIKVFAAGDILQRGVDLNEINYNVGRVSGIFAPNLFLTIRAQNNQQRDNNDILSSYIRSVSRYWENKNVSTQKVFDFELSEGINLKYFQDVNTFNGSRIVKETVPLDVLASISNNIKANPAKMVGILANESGDISDDLKSKLESAGIKESNYKIISPNKVQGQEFDYFIFNTSSIKEKSVFDALKAIYTFSSRAKNGTVIVNDQPIEFGGNEIKLYDKADRATEELSPMSAETIKELKDTRENELKTILEGKTNLSSDFKFNASADIPASISEETTISTDDSVDVDDSKVEGLIDNPVVKFALTKYSEGKYTGSKNIMIHTFYNDVNIDTSESGDDVIISKNLNSRYSANDSNGNKISSGLDYLLKLQNKTSLKLTKQQYKQKMDFIVRSKYDVLNKRKASIDLIKEVFGDGTIVLNEIEQSFVITVDSYKDSSNKPRELHYDRPEAHLAKDSKYLSLAMKLVNTKTGDEYYLHLGAFPTLETVQKTVDTVFNKFPDRKEVINVYKTLFNNAEIGKTIVIPDINKLLPLTSTRLWTDPSIQNKHISLRDLTNVPGIMFFDKNLKHITAPQINFFPTNEEDYVKLFKSTFFGRAISVEDEIAIRNSFNGDPSKPNSGRKGKPYIAVSFINDSESLIKSEGSTIRFITLHSEKRNWNQVEKIINGDGESTSLHERIIANTSKTGKDPEKAKRLAKVQAEAGSLFSGNDVLDLLIGMSIDPKGKELFDQMLSDGETWLDQIFKEKNNPANEVMIRTLFKDLGKELKLSVLDAITYSRTGMKNVYLAIKKEVESGNKDATKIKDKIISELLRKPENKYWFSAFWNIFKLEKALDKRVKENVIGANIDKRFLEVIDGVIAFWKSKKSEIYYNIPKEWNPITKEIGVSTNDETMVDMLYTRLSPEGPRLLLDLRDIVSEGTESTEEKKRFLNDPSNIDDSEVVEVIRYLKLPFGKKSGIAQLKNIISTSNKSIDEIKEAVDLVRQKNDEVAQEIIKLSNELNKIKFNSKTIIPSEPEDSKELLLSKIEKAKLINKLLVENKGTFEELIILPVSKLNERIGATSPEEVWKNEIAKIKSTLTTSDPRYSVYQKLELALEGKTSPSDTKSNKLLIEQTIIVLNALKNVSKDGNISNSITDGELDNVWMASEIDTDETNIDEFLEIC